MENQEGILFLIHVYLKRCSFIPILNASSLILYLTLFLLVLCNLYNIRIFGRDIKSTVWMSCAWQSEGAGVVLTWFPATEVESQPVCELILDLHQPLCQLVVSPLPAHTQGQGTVSDTQKWSEKQVWYKPTLHVFDAPTHHRHTADSTPCAPTHLCSLGHSYSSSPANPHSCSLNLHKIFSN